MGYGDYMPGFNPAMAGGMPGMRGPYGQPSPQQGMGGIYSQPNMGQFANSANVFLQQYGMQEPTPDQINPYLFFGNTGAMANHPGIASAIDNGLSGLAFTQGSRTWGEGMSNVAQGILGSRQAHVQNYVNQYMRPLQMAGQLQEMQGTQAKIGLENAQAGYYNDKIEATRPVIDPWSGRVSTFDKAQGKWVTTDPPAGTMTHGSVNMYGADQRLAGQKYAVDLRKEANKSGKTQAERVANLREADEVENGGQAWSPKQRANQIEIEAARLVGGATGARKGAGQAMGDVPETTRLDYDTDKAITLHGLLKPGDIMDQFSAEEKGFKSVDDYNQDLKQKLQDRHPEVFAKPGPKSKAVAPKSGARPPLANFEKPKGQ